MQKVVWVRDLGHRAALLRIVCFAWVPGSSLPPCPTTLRSLPPLTLFHSPSLSLAGPYAQNLRLISSSAFQSALRISLLVCGLAFMRSLGVSEGLWRWRPEVQGRRWRACSVTPSPLLVIAVEWQIVGSWTARWAPRPSTVSVWMKGVVCCWLGSRLCLYMPFTYNYTCRYFLGMSHCTLFTASNL